MPAYLAAWRNARAQPSACRDSSTMPPTTNGTISHGVCLTAMARPIRTGPRHAAGPRCTPNRSQATAAPTSNGTNSASVTPPAA